MKRCLQGHQKALHRNYGILGLYLGSYLGTKSSPEDFRSRVHSLGLLPTIKEPLWKTADLHEIRLGLLTRTRHRDG